MGSIPSQFPGVVTPMGAPTWKLSTRAGSQGGSRRHTAPQARPGLPPGDQPRPARPTDTASHQARGRGHTHPEAWVQGRGSEAGPLSAPLPRTPAYPPRQPEPPRTQPACRGPASGAMLHPGDMPDTGRQASHALSKEPGGLGTPWAHSRRSSRTATLGPLQPAFHTTCLPTCYFPAPTDGREQKVSGQLARPSHCPSPVPGRRARPPGDWQPRAAAEDWRGQAPGLLGQARSIGQKRAGRALDGRPRVEPTPLGPLAPGAPCRANPQDGRGRGAGGPEAAWRTAPAARAGPMVERPAARLPQQSPRRPRPGAAGLRTHRRPSKGGGRPGRAGCKPGTPHKPPATQRLGRRAHSPL